MSPIKCITLEEEVKKTDELKMSDIQLLREWSEKQSHLPKIQDVQFAIFLHSNYYRLEPTKSTIENYYTFRTHVPEFFSNRDINMTELQECFKVVAHRVMNGKTKEGYNIMIAKFVDLEPSHFHLTNTIKCGFMTHDSYLWKHGSTPGYVWVFDPANVTFGHLARLNPLTLKKMICYVQDALPVRLKAVHILNMSPIIDALFNMVKPFFKPELLELIHFHSSMESAAKHFPIDELPNEMGGKAGPIREMYEPQIKKIEEFREWFLEDETINRVNESLRIGKSNISSEFSGVEGSFKKLEID